MASRQTTITGERPMDSFRHMDDIQDEEAGDDPGTAMLAMFSLMTLAIGAVVLYGLFSF